MNAQHIGLRHQGREAGRAANAQGTVGAIRQGRIEEHHIEAKGLGPQRHRGADAAQAQYRESLHRHPAHQRRVDHPPGGGRVGTLRLVMQEQAAP